MPMHPTRAREARRGVAAGQLRRHNLGAVLEHLHLVGPRSRSQLVAGTGLNRSTIGDLVGSLVELGLVTEDSGPSGGGPGRPSAVARVAPGGAVALAVDVQVDSVAAATVGLGGRVFDRAWAPSLGGPATPADAVDALVPLAADVRARLPAAHALVGVGAAVAGVVRRDDAFLHDAPNLGWSGVPLGAMLRDAIGIDRVLLVNEADAGALAEHRRGAARGVRDLVCVSGEVGVGVGVIHDGRPMLGTSGYAGEAGHTVVNPWGRPCRCGSTGCWETEVGEEALADRAGVPDSVARGDLVDELLRRANAGDDDVFAAFDAVGWWLGVGVANLVNTLNPELVVFGGVYDRLYPHLEQAIRRSAASAAMTAPWDACTLARSELGADARLIGAAELALTAVLTDPAGPVVAAAGG